MSKGRRKLLLLVLAAIFLVVVWRLGALAYLSNPIRLKEALLALGVWGYLVYVLGFGFIEPFGVPGTVFLVGASLVWPPPVAILLSLAGSGLATVNGFSFARYVARDWVEKKLPERFRKYDARLAEGSFVTVFLLRLVFWFAAWLHAVMGVSRVGFWTHLAASMVAYVPVVIIITYLGDAALSVIKNQPPWQWASEIGAVLVIFAIAFGVRLYRRKKLGSAPDVALSKGL